MFICTENLFQKIRNSHSTEHLKLALYWHFTFRTKYTHHDCSEHNQKQY